MFKKILTYFFIFSIILLAGCGKDWRITTEIHPEILEKSSSDLSISYELGPLTIIDTIHTDAAKIFYIEKNKKNIYFSVDITKDSIVGRTQFTYYINRTILNITFTNPTSIESIESNASSIPGFKWVGDEEKTTTSISNDNKGKL